MASNTACCESNVQKEARSLATWVTFIPCFLWIFLGAPFIEIMRGNKALAGALSAITATVVGVVLKDEENEMSLRTLTTLLALTIAVPALAEPDWKAVGQTLGKEGAVAAGVYRVGLPRTDLTVTLDGVDIKPGFALGSWLAFKPVGYPVLHPGLGGDRLHSVPLHHPGGVKARSA